MDRFACPTMDGYGRYLCIDDQHICDGTRDCPKGEDEDPKSCMFYKSVSVSHFLVDCNIDLHTSSPSLSFPFDRRKLTSMYSQTICCNGLEGVTSESTVVLGPKAPTRTPDDDTLTRPHGHTVETLQ